MTDQASTKSVEGIRDLRSLENRYLIVGFLAPGLIVLSVQSQFVTGGFAPNLGMGSIFPGTGASLKQD